MLDTIIFCWLLLVDALVLYYGLLCYFGAKRALDSFSGESRPKEGLDNFSESRFVGYEPETIAVTRRLGIVYIFWSVTMGESILNRYDSNYLLLINAAYSVLLSAFVHGEKFYARKAVKQNLIVAGIHFGLLFASYYFTK